MIRIEDPNIVFIMETQYDSDWMEKVQDRCGFKQGLIVPSVGNSGGLTLFKKKMNFKSMLLNILCRILMLRSIVEMVLVGGTLQGFLGIMALLAENNLGLV